MLRTTKSGRVIKIPSDEEDERINAGVALDDDTYELSAAELSQLKRVSIPVAPVLPKSESLSVWIKKPCTHLKQKPKHRATIIKR